MSPVLTAAPPQPAPPPGAASVGLRRGSLLSLPELVPVIAEAAGQLVAGAPGEELRSANSMDWPPGPSSASTAKTPREPGVPPAPTGFDPESMDPLPELKPLLVQVAVKRSSDELELGVFHWVKLQLRQRLWLLKEKGRPEEEGDWKEVLGYVGKRGELVYQEPSSESEPGGPLGSGPLSLLFSGHALPELLIDTAKPFASRASLPPGQEELAVFALPDQRSLDAFRRLLELLRKHCGTLGEPLQVEDGLSLRTLLQAAGIQELYSPEMVSSLLREMRSGRSTLRWDTSKEHASLRRVLWVC